VINLLIPVTPPDLSVPVLSAGTAENAQCAVTAIVNHAPAVHPDVTVQFAPAAASAQDVVTAHVKTATTQAATAKNVRIARIVEYVRLALVPPAMFQAVPVLSANVDHAVYPVVVLHVNAVPVV